MLLALLAVALSYPSQDGLYFQHGAEWVQIKPLVHASTRVRGKGMWPATRIRNVFVYRGKAAVARTPQPVFYLAGKHPLAERNAVIVRLEVRGNGRELQFTSGGAVQHRERDVFEVTVSEAEGGLVLRPKRALPPGEYVLSPTGLPAGLPVYDFGVPAH